LTKGEKFDIIYIESEKEINYQKK